MHVVICGGGVIGACTAYFLTRRGVAVTVVERTDVACAASGKAGGFLARDWCDGSPLQALVRRSFELHAELATQIDGDWGYRRLTTYGGIAGFRTRAGHANAGYEVAWLSPGVAVTQGLGSPDTTAQVHPAERAEERGARVTAVEADEQELGHTALDGQAGHQPPDVARRPAAPERS